MTKGLIFRCQFCPDTFSQFKDLVRYYETHHNQEGEQFQYRTDIIGYRGKDSGCQRATDYLGHQSSCLFCPFSKCDLDGKGVGIATIKKRSRNEEIIQRLRKGENTSDLAIAFGVSQRTIQRVIKMWLRDG